MDIAFDAWRNSMREEGILIAHGLVRMTNTRYADDVLFYAKSFEELESMTERLVNSLRRIDLTLKTKTIKIL